MTEVVGDQITCRNAVMKTMRTSHHQSHPLRRFGMRSVLTLGLAVVVVFSVGTRARAQGVIFGTLQNADLTNPAAAELRWFGFLDGTDEEIRIETNTGAGYDGTNWFDDFQNYTTEAAGNIYEFVYVDRLKAEAFRLTGIIPSNSFQQENVVLVSAVTPATPTGLSATVVSPTQIDLHWTLGGGLSYHVYRRDAANNGVFRRIDEPSGNLSNHGIAGGQFSDLNSDGITTYVYLLIADDGAGNYSAHSEPLTIDAAGPTCACLCQGDFDCNGNRDAVDLNALIDILFFAGANVMDEGCPTSRADVDCDGSPTALDLNTLIDHLFFSGAAPCDPCIP